MMLSNKRTLQRVRCNKSRRSGLGPTICWASQAQPNLPISVLKTVLLSTLLSFFLNVGWAENASMTQTNDKIKLLDNQINKLKQTLTAVHDKQGAFNQALAATEKQISEGIRQLRTIQNNMASTRQKITTLQQTINNLNQQLVTQQQLLAHHVQTRYIMGEYQPMKWLLNQDDPYAISRLLTFYQYLVQSRQETIEKIGKTKQNLITNQKTLNAVLIQQQQLQQQLSIHQQQLERNKHYHQVVIQSFNQEIQTQQHTLLEYQRNKENLSRLLKTLALKSTVQTTQPLNHMHHKLLFPVQGSQQSFQKMNQGVTFFAGEGAPVTAVYPGKVVFSDWLRGYGLLLILDHGQGLMTLYAHNQSLYKQKGETVLQGEQIATVGHSGGSKQDGLYFEVRRNGKAVSSKEWLG